MPRHPLRPLPPGYQLAYNDGPEEDGPNPIFGAKPAGWYILHHWRLVAGPYKERWYAVNKAHDLARKEYTKATAAATDIDVNAADTV